jgi:hypothetical protein
MFKSVFFNKIELVGIYIFYLKKEISHKYDSLLIYLLKKNLAVVNYMI